MQVINDRMGKSDIYVITNGGDDGDKFLRQVREKGIKTDACVFCGAVDWHKKWAEKLDQQFNCKTTVTGGSSEVTKFVERVLKAKF